jgi:hypothetical protein
MTTNTTPQIDEEDWLPGCKGGDISKMVKWCHRYQSINNIYELSLLSFHVSTYLQYSAALYLFILNSRLKYSIKNHFTFSFKDILILNFLLDNRYSYVQAPRATIFPQAVGA